MIYRIRTSLAHRCGYRVVSNGRWRIITCDGQTVRAFDTKQHAIDAGKAFAAMERTSISWSNDDGYMYGADYRKKGIGRIVKRLLCTILNRKHQSY